MKLVICSDGVMNYTPVTAENPSRAISFAAAEFARFFKESTGAKVAIRRLPFFSERNVFLGTVPPDEKERAKLGNSGYSVKFSGKDIYISGNCDYSIIYGVYGLLARLIGLEFYTGVDYKLDRKKTVEAEIEDYIDVPDIDTRHIGFYDAVSSPENAHRLRVIQNDMSFRGEENKKNGEVFCGDIVSAIWGGLWAHTMMKDILPVEKDSDGKPAHPEYYNDKLNQLCFTNDKMRAVFTEKLERIIAVTPDAPFFMLGISDNSDYCRCAECEKINRAYGASAAQTLFVKKVAEDIEKWRRINFPKSNFKLVMFAYNEYKKAPATEKNGKFYPLAPELALPDNTAVMIAPLDACGFHALDAPCNKKVLDRIKGWRAVCKTIVVWDYHIYFDNYLIYLPTEKNYARNIKIYAENGVGYLYCEGSLYGKAAGFAALKTYLLSKLSWNADADCKALTRDFFAHYYYSAAKPLKKYYDALASNYARAEKFFCATGDKGYHTAFETVWQPDVFSEKIWGFEFLLKCEKLLSEALLQLDGAHGIIGGNSWKNHEKTERAAERTAEELLGVKYLILNVHGYKMNTAEYYSRLDELKKYVARSGEPRFRHGYPFSDKLSFGAVFTDFVCRWPARGDETDRSAKK